MAQPTMKESTFSDGVFKQKLRCLRIPIQPADLLQKGLRINPSESPPTVIEGASPPKTQIASNGAAQGAA
jgi:hypothetical protein